MNSVLPSITVVVPVYNEEFTILSCLHALRNQDYQGSYSILVIDNASTDRSAEIARGEGCEVIYESNKGYVHAIKRGFDSAETDIIACTDADSLPGPNWLSKIAENLSNDGVVACSGSFRFHDGTPQLKLIGYIFGRCNWHLAGANMAVWRWAYKKAGGLSSKVNLGADVELGFRLKKIGKLKIDSSLIVWTSARRFQCAFWRTVFRYYTNDLCLLLFRHPVFYSFVNYRLNPGVRMRFSMSTFAISLLLLVFIIPFTRTAGARDIVVFPKELKVALTFDDGPSRYTDQLLDTLKSKGAHATFFILGKSALRFPDVVEKINRDGHAIGNHSFSHFVWSGFVPRKYLIAELDKTTRILTALIGKKISLFRPPHGWRSHRMDTLCKTEEYTEIFWDVDPKDWQKQSSSHHIIKYVLQNVQPGSIILLHDGLEGKPNPHRENTIRAIGELIDSLKLRGYSCVTVPELLANDQLREQLVHEGHVIMAPASMVAGK